MAGEKPVAKIANQAIAFVGMGNQRVLAPIVEAAVNVSMAF
jgi:hypothetical protein